MANNTVEIDSVTFSEDWIGGVEDDNIKEVFEVEFALKSDNEEGDDKAPEISGTISYKVPYPHAASLKVLNRRLTKAFDAVAGCLADWAESARQDAEIGANWHKKNAR